jgi:hypothetical protein
VEVGRLEVSSAEVGPLEVNARNGRLLPAPRVSGSGALFLQNAERLFIGHGDLLARVFVVIPFTSIIEQTAQVCREALGVLGCGAGAPQRL